MNFEHLTFEILFPESKLWSSCRSLYECESVRSPSSPFRTRRHGTKPNKGLEGCWFNPWLLISGGPCARSWKLKYKHRESERHGWSCRYYKKLGVRVSSICRFIFPEKLGRQNICTESISIIYYLLHYKTIYWTHFLCVFYMCIC